MTMSCQEMDPLGMYMELKLDPFINEDMKDFSWDSDLDQDITDALRGTEDTSDWLIDGNGRSNSHVVLHDRLITDAVMFNAPIKAEHSYCTTHGSSESLDAIDLDEDSSQDGTCKLTFDEVRCDRTGNIEMISIKEDTTSIKDEPMSDQEYVETSSCPPSPCSASDDTPRHYGKVQKTSYKEPTTVVLTSRAFLNQPHRLIVPNFGLKMDGTGFSLPPTPPSSTSSDSEGGNVSPHHRSSPTRRLFLSTMSSSSSSSSSLAAASATITSSRQPIQTPLISCQPKGSTGALTLTEEEKRTLLAEGYPIPTRLPLTKAEEKSLKKIRRKIKNKISAQESRRKKKEYMDTLERKVDILVTENCEYKKKIVNLEESNGSLVQQLQKLQKLLGLQATHISQQLKTK
ncbi:cyclic AMP response element-binding protein A-like [Metopolophium dirhodum]|uniref:cyclic AMP response element-binding protein A-like n=1 Tax=Metopolophium dirhodum TaxID=44670 RepID=UPI00298FD3AE|nr:cyclic AMP response element-binding protein A-like [Metopolophium dirhodum]